MTASVQEMDKLPFWPALVVVATPEDAAAAHVLFSRVLLYRPSLTLPRIEVCLVPGVVEPGEPEMFRNEDAVPAFWLAGSRDSLADAGDRTQTVPKPYPGNRLPS